MQVQKLTKQLNKVYSGSTHSDGTVKLVKVQ